jgi:hypothetical protein
MVKGLVEELGHEYQGVFRAASFSAFNYVGKDCLLKLQEKLIISSKQMTATVTTSLVTTINPRPAVYFTTLR